MVGWHHQLNEHKFEQALRDGEGQGILVCCSPWGRNELDMTERLNNKCQNNNFKNPGKNSIDNGFDARRNSRILETCFCITHNALKEVSRLGG